jgi:hypothetical protein
MRNDVYMFDAWNSSEIIAGSVTDCYRMISSNETDIFPIMEIYGAHSDIMKYFSQIKDSSNVIISAYRPSNQTELRTTGSLQALSYFAPSVVVLIVMFIGLFYTLFYLYCRTCKMLKPLVFIIVTNSSGEDQHKRRAGSNTPTIILMAVLLKQMTACFTSRRKRLSFRLLLLLFMALMAGIQFMFVSFTKTELVVVDEPFVFDSYNKLLSHASIIMPAWIAYEKTYESFMGARKGTMEHKLWMKARSRICPQDYHQCLLSPKSDDAANFVTSIANQEIAIISIDYAARLIHTAVCPLSRMMSLNPIIMRVDKDATVNEPLALSYSWHFYDSSPAVSAVLNDRGMRVAQSGIILHVSMPTESIMASITDPENVRRCLHPHPDDTNHKVFILSKSWTDYQILLYICVCLIVIACFNLMISIAISHHTRTKGLINPHSHEVTSISQTKHDPITIQPIQE